MSANNTLDNLGNIANIANNYQLERIKGDLQRLSRFTEDAALHQENQRNLRQQIFEIRDLIQKSLPTIKEGLVKYIYLLQIKNMITSNGISTASFDEIHDKQFYSDTIDSLHNQIAQLSIFSSVAVPIKNKLDILEQELKALKNLKILITELKDKTLDKTTINLKAGFIAFGFGFILIFGILLIIENVKHDQSWAGLVFFSVFLGGLSVVFIISKYIISRLILQRNDTLRWRNIISIFEGGGMKEKDYSKELISLLKIFDKDNVQLKCVEIVQAQIERLKKEYDNIYEKYPELKSIV